MIDSLLIAIIVILSFFLIFVTYKMSKMFCPAQRIEYRFAPKTFKEEQENPIKVSEIFASMFNDATPGSGYALFDKPKSALH